MVHNSKTPSHATDYDNALFCCYLSQKFNLLVELLLVVEVDEVVVLVVVVDAKYKESHGFE